jgi:glycosyltransferase involved in cell wall biosynthesis
MRRPTFSVIVPTYNRAELVQRTLQTVFDQLYPAHEIIVVDNCSTDGTEEVLRPLAEQNLIVFIKHARNLERAASRNTGMAQATGDFVTFLDSDDLMYRDNLADAACFARRYPDVRLFHNLYEHVGPDGHLIRRRRFARLRDPVRAIANGNFMSCIGNFVHRELYTELRFDTDPLISGSEDWEFWLRAIARAWPGRINKFNSGVVNHPARTVNDIDLGAMRVRLSRVVEKVLGDPELGRVYAPHRNRMEAAVLLLLASAANTSGKPRAARELIAEASRVNPGSLASEKAARIVVHTLFGVIKLRGG